MDNKDLGRSADAAGLSPTVEPASSLAGSAASIPSAKKWSRMPTWKRALRPIAEQFARQFRNLDDEYLAALVEAEGQVSSTNCWWVEFHVAHAAAEIARAELDNRKPASAIETGTAETEGLGPKAESAVGESRDAQGTVA